MKNKVLFSLIALVVLSAGLAVNAQGGKFFRFADNPTVYKSYGSPEEFFKDGGAKDWSNVDVIEPIVGGASGLAATQLVATTTAVGPQVNKELFAKRPSCGSRVVSTRASEIVITFGDPSSGDISSTTLTSAVGFLQAASTTVAYDAEIYGCGRWFVYGLASSTITRAEF